MIKKIQGISTFLERCLLGLCIAAMIAMTILVFVMVITRYGFGFVYSGTEELSLLLVIWSALIASAVILRRRNHIKVNVLMRHISGVPRILINICRSILIVMYLGILTKYAIIQAIRNLKSISAALGIPLFWWYTSIYVSAVFMILFSGVNLLEDIAELVTYRKNKEV